MTKRDELIKRDKIRAALKETLVADGEALLWNKDIFAGGRAMTQALTVEQIEEWRKELLKTVDYMPLTRVNINAICDMALCAAASVSPQAPTAQVSSGDSQESLRQGGTATGADWVDVPRDTLVKVTEALQRHLDGRAPRRIPVDPSDSDLVLYAVSVLLSAAPRPDAGEGHTITATETDTQLLRAFTPKRYAGHYPWYWNLTMVRMKGDIVLTVRLPTVAGEPAGATSSVRFTREMWRTFIKQIKDANEVFEACDANDAEM